MSPGTWTLFPKYLIEREENSLSDFSEKLRASSLCGFAEKVDVRNEIFRKRTQVRDSTFRGTAQCGVRHFGNRLFGG
jgi:hypothetical protein